MFKIFENIVEAVYWIAIFLSPLLASVLLALAAYGYLDFPFALCVVIVIVGGIAGVFLAEYIRKKYGCSYLWSRTAATPDIDPQPGENEKDIYK